jgi:uncharacterized protein (DUF433 family)
MRPPHPRIVQDARIMMGKPVIRNTRTRVETVLRRLGEGRSVETVLQSYSGLSEDDVAEKIARRMMQLGKTLPGRLTIIEPGRTRQRDLASPDYHLGLEGEGRAGCGSSGLRF